MKHEVGAHRVHGGSPDADIAVLERHLREQPMDLREPMAKRVEPAAPASPSRQWHLSSMAASTIGKLLNSSLPI